MKLQKNQQYRMLDEDESEDEEEMDPNDVK